MFKKAYETTANDGQPEQVVNMELRIKNRPIEKFSSSASEMVAAIHALIFSASSTLTALYYENPQSREMSEIHRYSRHLYMMLENSGKADLYDVIDAGRHVAHLLEQGKPLPDPAEVRTLIMSGEDLGLERLKKPQIHYTETEAQRAERVVRQLKDDDTLISRAAEKGRVCILLPVTEGRRYKMLNPSIRLSITGLPHNFDEVFNNNKYETRPPSIDSLNEFLFRSVSARENHSHPMLGP